MLRFNFVKNGHEKFGIHDISFDEQSSSCTSDRLNSGDISEMKLDDKFINWIFLKD